MTDHLYHARHLAHHGIKGMKWGIRRFRNKDGSLTEAGKERYRTFDAEKQKIRGYASNLDRAAKKQALAAKQLNSAYYDENDDKKVARILDDIYGPSVGAGSIYLTKGSRDKAGIVGMAYNDTRIGAANNAASAVGYRKILDVMDKAGDADVFRIKNRDKDFDKYYKVGMKEAQSVFAKYSNMTATELMLNLGMDNEYTRHYNEMFPSKRQASNSAISKHIKYDQKGRIVSISPELERAIGTSLSDVDDPELLELVAQELESR